MPTLIATLGAADANSYIADVATAAALLDQELFARTAWDAASDDDKKRALITGARVIDTTINWEGNQRSDVQAMAWPRISFVRLGYIKYGPHVGVDDVPYPYPSMLPKMQALMAASLLERKTAGQSSGGVDATAAIKRMKAGSVELEYKDSATFIAGYSIPDEIFQMAYPWGTRLDRGQVEALLVRG